MVLPKHIAASLSGTWLFLNQTKSVTPLPILQTSLTLRSTDSNGNATPSTMLGSHPVGQLIYDSQGYMSASITSTDPSHIPPNRAPNNSTQEDYALIAQHVLAYAGPLSVEWENSTATVGRLIHGPLTMSTAWNWLGTNQSRNYILTKNASASGGNDVLHLWIEAGEGTANLYWERAEPV
jgi:hypothetical protein